MEPHIDAKTMEIHHDKHHNTYVSKLNEAVKGSIFQGKSLGYIFENISPDAGHSAFRNHGGGHYNHSLFWTILTPRRDMQPSGKLLEAIIAHWGSVEKLFVELKDVGLKTFGSGWVWLCVAPDKSLFTMQTPNQDNPLMIKVAARTGIPILGIDVWEHAYYLQYQNKRGEYLEGVMRLLNWEEIGRRYLEALGA
jgi:Fe-Mn family superoxide dismutase